MRPRTLDGMPSATPSFWVAVVLTTPVGAAVAGFLDGRLGFGLGFVTALQSGMFIVAVAVQLAVRRYHPVASWAVIVCASAVAGLVSSDLTDVLGLLPLLAAGVLLVALAGALSADHVARSHHEDVQWVVVLLAFAVGCALTGVLPVVAAAGALVVLLALRPHAHGPAFWTALALTRPVGIWVDGLTTPVVGTAWTAAAHLGLVAVLVGGSAAWAARGHGSLPGSAQRQHHPEGRTA